MFKWFKNPKQSIQISNNLICDNKGKKLKCGLYPYQILLLEYCSYETYPNPKNGYPIFWKRDYNIENVENELFHLAKIGLIEKNINGKFKLTDQGKSKLESYAYIPYLHKHKIPEISIIEMCSIMENEKRPYRDVIWGRLNKELLQYAKYEKWGLYRNMLITMGDFLSHEGKDLDALFYYCNAAFLDVNMLSNKINDGSKIDLDTVIPIGLVRKIRKTRNLAVVTHQEFFSAMIQRFDGIIADCRILSNEDTANLICKITE